MQPADFGSLLLRPLASTGLPYMVTGGLATIAYGEPRLTNDVDVVLAADPAGVLRIIDAFASAEYYVPPAEVLQTEAARTEGGHFNLLHHGTALRGDIYLAGKDPFMQWALGERSTASVDGIAIPLAPIEYVLLQKLRYFRDGGSDRHLRDMRAILRLSGDLVQATRLADWRARLGLESTWRLALGAD